MPAASVVLQALHPLAARQHGALAGRQLKERGLSRDAIKHLVRRGAIARAGQSVYVLAGTPSTWHQSLWVAILDRQPAPRGSDDVSVAVVARRSAAALHGLPGFGFDAVDLLLHERRNRDRSEPRRQPVDVRATSWLPPRHVTTVAGLPTTTLARTIFDLAGLSSEKRLRGGKAYVHPKRVERTLDTALGRGLDIALVAEVVATLGARGRPGTALMRELLDERSAGYVATESELEDLVLAVLAAHDVPLPERQVVIGDGAGTIGRVDFFYPAARLVIEADSRRHHTSLLDWRSDRDRDARLAAAGIRVIRVTWRDLVENPEAFAATVLRALRYTTAA